jgi:hypothetical protein
MTDADLGQIDNIRLTPVVRRLLDRPDARVLDFGRAPLDYPLINPIAGGIHRFHGHAALGADTVPFSLILKVSHPPAGGVTPRGIAPPGWAEEPDHWNYWRREARLYESGVLARLPGPLVAPRCCGVEERAGPSCWLWLEEINDDDGAAWPIARFGPVAEHFGHLAGRYVGLAGLPRAPWLTPGWLRSWIDDVWASLRPLIRNPDAWHRPLVRDAFPNPPAERLERLWDERERFLTALDNLPQSFSHRDAYPANLFTRRAPDGSLQTVAIDWTQAGPGPIGEDVGQILFPSLLFMYVDAGELPEFARTVFDGYMAGLRAAGWPGDEREVRLGYCASTALHWAFAGAYALRWAENEQLGQTMAARFNSPLDAIVRQRAAITYYLLDLADEARSLLS